MNIFDIIGPVMIGPSSSHTAGAVRIGKIARQLFSIQPEKAVITLYGSFALTGRGHGTDKALVAGLLGFDCGDIRIRNSLSIAAEAGMAVLFRMDTETQGIHPNSARIELSGKGRTLDMFGSSVGGGNIVISRINGVDIRLTGKSSALLVAHRDVPGTVASVTDVLAESHLNIANMNVYRSKRGGSAAMVIETDEELPDTVIGRVSGLPNILKTIAVRPV